MAPRFFIDRPVFAWVIALGILIAGIIALRALPIEQYPSVAPPSLTIAVTYPGADANTLEQNVTQVIEQELNGIEGFLYMSSNSQSNGTASINLTFAAGTDIDRAQMDVQNRLRRVEQRLPEDVRRQGIQVNEANAGFLMIVALTSKSGQMESLEIGNFANTKVVDELRRVEGVGNVQSFSPSYAMRIWLDPEKLASFSMSPAEVLGAVQEQNSQTPGGQLGDQPLAGGSELNAIITTQGRFTSPEQFRAIILRANPDGSAVTLGDVARVELGAESYIFSSELNGKPMAGMAVQLGTMPGPTMVVHQGDYVELTLVNPSTSLLPHNIDFHAATGALGGAGLTLINPGEQVTLRFKATRTGVFVYHCAPEGMVAWHVVSGMHGVLMVLPRAGLADPDGKRLTYDKVFTIGEFDLYVPTDAAGGFKSYPTVQDAYEDTMEAMRGLVPSHIIFNGAHGALTGDNALKAKVGERVLFIHSQANRDTRPHLIGGHGDWVWETGKFANPPQRDLETWFVRGGSAGAALYTFRQPGLYVYLNHNLIEATLLGAAAHVQVEGKWNDTLMKQIRPPGPIQA